MAIQSSSHNCRIDSKEELVKPGYTKADVAELDKLGIGRLPVLDGYIFSLGPFEIECVLFKIFLSFSSRKYFAAPESHLSIKEEGDVLVVEGATDSKLCVE